VSDCVIDHDKVKAISGDLQNSLVPQIKTNLRTLDDSVQQLFAQWDGEKKRKFYGTYTQWQTDSGKLHPTLLAYSQKLQETAQGFALADQA